MVFPDPSITEEDAAAASSGPEAEPTAVEAADEAADRARAGRRAPARPAPARARRSRRPADRLIVQPGVRTVFVPAGWHTGVRMTDPERAAWLRKRRVRELVLLTMLSEHRFLTTQQLKAMFWPTAHLRSAQLHLQHLARDLRLVMRWPQVEPVPRGERRPATWWGFRHHSSVWLLTELGAAVAAAYRKLDQQALVRRSFYSAHTTHHPEHTLGMNGFWVSLAAAASELAQEGLYTWLGDDAARGIVSELEGADLRPDGWGRYLTQDREVRFSLEWDAGTEPPKRLAGKARAYLKHYAGRGRPETTHVLIVLPGHTREDSIADAVRRALPAKPSVRFWTTHTGLLRDRGPLGELWREVGGGGRLRLPELPGRSRTALRVEDCIGKPAWWERRPGGGGGA
jgi:hypothetical protein